MGGLLGFGLAGLSRGMDVYMATKDIIYHNFIQFMATIFGVVYVSWWSNLFYTMQETSCLFAIIAKEVDG